MLRPIAVARVFFVLLATAWGYWVKRDAGGQSAINTAILAFILALILVLFEYSLRTVSTKRFLLAATGLIFGLAVSSMVYKIIPSTVMDRDQALIFCHFLFGYLGMMIALKHADTLNFGDLKFFVQNPQASETRILDTSVIIDGRISEVIPAGFMPGTIVVPTFVINELQTLADSGDPIKRNKGRRGLSILENLQESYPNLQIVDKDYPGIREVDRKLIEMAREWNAQVVTNDFNLQKVAGLHKIPVLNLNELADMLRPSVYVGETFKLEMNREGKEPGQALGYLKDGTMVVVDDARDYIGSEIEVVVTSILQTNTGRMIFARPRVTDPSS